ncbi:MAG: hydroxypyruvate reductase, partial [Deltaproteobacteria bacterium]
PPPAAGPARSGEVEIVVGMDSAAEAARAFLAARGYDLVAPPLARLEGDGTVAAEKIARFLLELAGRARAAFVLAGETTLRLPDRVGRGGRNQHLAALVARRLDGVGGVAFVAGGTDGIDGNSDAAGAVVDGTTASRARRAGADLDRAIEAFDTHTALAAAGATLTPGPTGTNLGDLVVGISGAPA